MSRKNLERKVAEYLRGLEETPLNEVSNAFSEVFSESDCSEMRIFKSTDEAMNHVLLYEPYTSLRKADGLDRIY